MRFRFTEKEIKKALDRLVIIIDSREQKSNNYKSEWDRSNIKYFSKEEYNFLNKEKRIPKSGMLDASLPAGDYSCYLPAGALEGINKPLWFDKKTVIEKKGSIDELAGNIGKKDLVRMRNEFARLKANGTRYRIFIEDALYFKHLYKGIGQNNGWKDSNSLGCAISRELSYWNCELIPVPREYMAQEIYRKLKYDVKAILEEEFLIKELDKLI